MPPLHYIKPPPQLPHCNTLSLVLLHCNTLSKWLLLPLLLLPPLSEVQPFCTRLIVARYSIRPLFLMGTVALYRICSTGLR